MGGMSDPRLSIPQVAGASPDLLEEAGFRRLLQRAPLLGLRAGTPIYLEEEPATRAYFICHGEISLFLSTEQGDEIEVGRCGRGSVAGIEALVSHRYHASARAATDSAIQTLEWSELDRLLGETPEVAHALFAELIEEIRCVQHHLLDIVGRSAVARLASLLLAMAAPGRQGLEMQLPWGSKARLAHRLAIKQETLSRAFQELSGRGAIRLHRWGVEIVDPDLLRQILH
jgi:CRP-like cAMP-binding protein